MPTARSRSRSRRPRQLTLDFRPWGGVRSGAGRPNKSGRKSVSHRTRETLPHRFPVHVTLRLREDLPSLRNPALFADVRRALRFGRARFGFRLNHFSVQSNHMHLIVEATGRPALSRGMQGLGVRLAKTINARLRRAGKVFSDRYHEEILKCPRQVRNTLVYVLKNARRHGLFQAGFDHYSSGAWFDGWKDAGKELGVEAPNESSPVVPPRTWLLAAGWRRRGLIPVQTLPQLRPR